MLRAVKYLPYASSYWFIIPAEYRIFKYVHGLNLPHKGPVTRKMFPFDDVIIMSQGNMIIKGWSKGFSAYIPVLANVTWALIQYKDVILPV